MSKILPFLSWLPLIKNTWKQDLIAGLTGTVIIIPQAVAFAIIAGLPPSYGFYTAILTPIIAAIFGSSYHLVSGPTTTSSIVLYSIISKYYLPETNLEAFISLAILLSFMAGIIKLAMGFAKMGKLVNFVSHSVIIGFSAGAGVLIAFKQLKYIFNLEVPQGSSVYQIITYISSHINETDWYTFGIALFTLILALSIKQIKKISGLYMLIPLILGSLLTYWITYKFIIDIETIGKIPSRLPVFKIPDFNYQNMKMLSSGAFVLATLGLVEASAISRSIAMKSHQKLNANQEFISQGLSNTISSFFSCYTSSGSFTRSSINYQVGAKTPLSAIISAIGLLIVVLLFADYASFLSKPAMGGIILLVSYNLINIRQIKQIIKTSNKELIVLVTTFLATLLLSLEEGLIIGVFLSLFFYLERTSKPNIARLGLTDQGRFTNTIRSKTTKECDSLTVIRIDGSIYFGAIEEVSDYFNKLYEDKSINNLLIISNGINFIDYAGSEWLTNEVLKWQKNKCGIYFSGMKIISQDILKKGGFLKKMGYDIFFTNKKDAINKIHQKIKKPCKCKVFKECN